MSDADLERVAQAAGIDVHWRSAFGEEMTTSPEVLRTMLDALGVPCRSSSDLDESLARFERGAGDGLPPLVTGELDTPVRVPVSSSGRTLRYRLHLEAGGVVEGDVTPGGGFAELPGISSPGYHVLEIDARTVTLAVAPPRCFSVADLGLGAAPRLWGSAVQLYSLRGGGRAGAGDFSALAQLARGAAGRGAAAVAISPVHAMFAADPSRFSPYSPSSRLFLNGILADPAQMFGAEAAAHATAATGVQDELARLDNLPLIDWPAVARARLKVFRHLYEHHLRGTALSEDFSRFSAEGGDALRDHARYEALHCHLLAQDPGFWGWRVWPQEYRSPESPAVALFAEEHAEEVGFHRFVQWLAARGLQGAQAAARDAGMPIGIIADLAVGTDGGGSQGWTRQGEILVGLSAGAPPDLLNQMGQGWGISAFSPTALRATGFRAFIEMLRASFAHAGGVRIDHVMGLMRLWLVPDGASPRDGAYVRFPFDDLLRLIRLESHRHRAIVVGEDLGTVPSGFRERMAAASVLGMRVLWFERDQSRFLSPSEWDANSMAMTTTHDLPTVAGWWEGRDIDWRSELGILGATATEAGERAQRANDRGALAAVFEANGLIPQGEPLDAQSAVDAAVALVGRTPSPLVIVPLEDFLGLTEAPNVPGTTVEHPNWRRRIEPAADRVFEEEAPARRASILCRARSAGAGPAS